MSARQFRLNGESFQLNLSNTINQLPTNMSLMNAVMERQSNNYEPNQKCQNFVTPHIDGVSTEDSQLLAPKRKASEREAFNSQNDEPNNPDEPLNLAIKRRHLNPPAVSKSEAVNFLSHAVDVPNDNSPFPAMLCEVTYDNDEGMETVPPNRNKRKISLTNNPIQEEPISLTNYTNYCVVNLEYTNTNKTPDAPIDFSRKVEKESAAIATATAIAVEKTFNVVPEISTNSDSISFGGTIHKIFSTSYDQMKQIELYKIEHKITSKQREPDDDVYMELGPKGTMVPFNELKKIDWTDALEATHDLLSLVFPLHVLETHGLSRRFTLLELDDDCKSRPRLDDNKFYDIQYYVTEKTEMSYDAFAYIVARRLLKLAKAKGYNPIEIS